MQKGNHPFAYLSFSQCLANYVINASSFADDDVNAQGQYWAGRAPLPNNGNYQYVRR